MRASCTVRGKSKVTLPLYFLHPLLHRTGRFFSLSNPLELKRYNVPVLSNWELRLEKRVSQCGPKSHPTAFLPA